MRWNGPRRWFLSVSCVTPRKIFKMNMSTNFCDEEGISLFLIIASLKNEIGNIDKKSYLDYGLKKNLLGQSSSLIHFPPSFSVRTYPGLHSQSCGRHISMHPSLPAFGSSQVFGQGVGHRFSVALRSPLHPNTSVKSETILKSDEGK